MKQKTRKTNWQNYLIKCFDKNYDDDSRFICINITFQFFVAS